MSQRQRSRQRLYANKNQKVQTYNKNKQQQKSSSIDRKSSQKSVPKQYPQTYQNNNAYNNTSYQNNQYSSPYSTTNNSMQIKKPSIMNINSASIDQQKKTQNYLLKPQKLSFRQLASKNIESIQDIATVLRNCKKPFLPTDIKNFQSIIDRLSNKYGLEQTYQIFIYYFIHSATLDQNVYRIFYSILSKYSIRETNQGQGLQIYYDVLIRTTLKSIFQQFKLNLKKLQFFEPSKYFILPHQIREDIMNKPLYTLNQHSFGCTVRAALTLIRKAMQKQKVHQRSSEPTHPIRIILKRFKQTLKSILKRIFIDKSPKQNKNAQKSSQNSFYLLIISELSLIIHYKYKFHVNAQYEETLNQITILKMKISEMQKQIKKNKKKLINMLQDNIQDKDDSKKNFLQQSIKNLNIEIKNNFNQHERNYIYLIFLLNLSQYNKTENNEIDSTILKVYLEPILEQNRKSSQFLQQKITQEQNKVCQKQQKTSQHHQKYQNASEHYQKLMFYTKIIKNYGIFSKQQIGQHQNNQLVQFTTNSYFSILQNTINYFMTQKNKSLQKDKHQQKAQVELQTNKFYQRIFACLSPFKTSFGQIYQFNQIFQKVLTISNSRIQEGVSQINIKSSHFQKQYRYLAEETLSVLLESIHKLVNRKCTQVIKKLNKENISQKEQEQIIQNFKGSEPNNKSNQVLVTQSRKDNDNSNNQQILSFLSFLSSIVGKNNSNLTCDIQILSFIYLLKKKQKLQRIYQFQALVKFIQQQRQQCANQLATPKNYSDKFNTRISIKQLINYLENQNSIEKWVLTQISQCCIDQDKIKKRKAKSLLKKINQACQKFNNILKAQKSISLDYSQSYVKYILLKNQNDQLIMIKNTLNKTSFNQNFNKSILLQDQSKDKIVQQQFQVNDLSIQIKVNKIILKIDTLKKQIQNYIELSIFTLNNQNKIKKNNLIQRKLNEKKIIILKKNIMKGELVSVLNSIFQLYQTIASNNALIIKGFILKVQKVVEQLLLQLYKLYDIFVNNNNYFTKDCNLSQQNQKQLYLQQYLLKKLNIKALAYSQFKVKEQKQIFSSIQNIFADILEQIYWKFKASFSQIKNQFNDSLFKEKMYQQLPKQRQYCSFLTQTQKNNVTNLEMSSNEQLMINLTLEDIFVQKIKKCISMFYDKMNQSMIVSYINQNRLFILRSLAITFYKIKTLSDILIVKLGSFDKHQDKYVSQQMLRQTKKIFFYITDNSLLELYVKYNATKDRSYLKSQLLKLNPMFQKYKEQARINQIIRILGE